MMEMRKLDANHIAELMLEHWGEPARCVHAPSGSSAGLVVRPDEIIVRFKSKRVSAGGDSIRDAEEGSVILDQLMELAWSATFDRATDRREETERMISEYAAEKPAHWFGSIPELNL